MDPSVRDELKGSFDRAAGQYQRGRPTYPLDAVRWLLAGDGAVPSPALSVLDLGAGTGALTRQLAAYVPEPIAAEPSHQMLLAAPIATRVQAFAEQLPFRSRAFDVVTIAQAFHWLDHAVALPEIARVLRPDGVLGVVYNTRDESQSWARRLGEILLSAQPPGLEGDWGNGSVVALGASAYFRDVQRFEVVHEHLVQRSDLQALAASRSYIIRLEESARAELLDEVGRLFDETVASGGPDVDRAQPGRLRLRYVTSCWRAAVVRTFSPR